MNARRAESVCIGNAGEHLVMAELLAKGFQAFMADRNNPAFDIAVDAGGVTSMLRVKTTTADYGAAQWSMGTGKGDITNIDEIELSDVPFSAPFRPLFRPTKREFTAQS